MVTIFGIRNCDKCRDAVKWFDKHVSQFAFHDVRKDGITFALVQRWQKSVGDDALINKRSTTWRGIADHEKVGLKGDRCIALILAHPTLLKRPVVECNGQVVVGYDESAWSHLLTNGTLSK